MCIECHVGRGFRDKWVWRGTGCSMRFGVIGKPITCRPSHLRQVVAGAATYESGACGWLFKGGGALRPSDCPTKTGA